MTSISSPDLSKTGYTFHGYDQTLPQVMPSHDMTQQAITQAFDTSVIAPETPIKENHTFLGWIPILLSNIPAGDVTIVAQGKSINIPFITV